MLAFRVLHSRGREMERRVDLVCKGASKGVPPYDAQGLGSDSARTRAACLRTPSLGRRDSAGQPAMACVRDLGLPVAMVP